MGYCHLFSIYNNLGRCGNKSHMNIYTVNVETANQNIMITMHQIDISIHFYKHFICTSRMADD